MYRFALLAVMFVSGLLGMTALGAVPDPDAFGTVTIKTAVGKNATIVFSGSYQLNAGYVVKDIGAYATPDGGGYVIAQQAATGPGKTWTATITQVPNGPHIVWAQMTLTNGDESVTQVVGSALTKNVNVNKDPTATRDNGGTVTQASVGRSQPIQLNVNGTVTYDATKWAYQSNTVPILNVIPVDGGVLRSQTGVYAKGDPGSYPYAASVNVNKDLKYNVLTLAQIQRINVDPPPPPYTAGSAWKENK